jgi:S1-C subfamily serine protease
MDVHKWAGKLGPAVPGELALDCFELARDVRLLDMEASPYDLSSYGRAPVAIETAEGKVEYVRRQRELADRAGIKAGEKEIDFQGERHIKIGGDVIVAVDGKGLTRRDDLADVISAKSAGDTVTLEVLRGHDRRSVSVKLGRRPLEPGG